VSGGVLKHGAMTVLLALLVVIAAGAACAQAALPPDGTAKFTGSQSCRECHEKFYELWSTSFHGLAMQPFTDALAAKDLVPQVGEIKIGEYTYRADLTPGAACIREKGPQGEKALPIVHALGGKNVYYFLTPADRGMLQTLPLAFDVQKKEWLDTAMSGMRHSGGGTQDQPVSWRDRAYTFNTSCYGCHVSQLSTNYDQKTDSYHTTWAEPGINCETCHGPCSEHTRVFKEAAPGTKPPLNLISMKALTAEQRNAACSSCHAKAQPITSSFTSGDRFFDHFGLVTLEDPDFYPDGRDLGENYTYTGWRMSPCAKSGQLDCVFCHTSSGRYRFKDADKANNACAPCHQDKVDNPTAHTRHKADSEGNQCVGCHMPKTEFARMVRHDHSMRPPTPATTMKYQSPNACNLCHPDKDAAWSDKYVREWRTRDYQAPVLERAGLVDAARKRDWTRLKDMAAYVQRPDRDEVTAASLLRLFMGATSTEKWPVLVNALKDTSPLVRGSAAEALNGYLTRESVPALLAATRDDYRLVRVRAAGALSAMAPGDLAAGDREALAKATGEFEASLRSRQDDYGSHYNLGNLHGERREYDQAVAEYELAMSLNPNVVAPLVNMSLLHSQNGHADKAEEALRRALKIDPRSAPAQFNLGLLLAETSHMAEAEACLRKALELDPIMAQAAYNLGVMLIQQGKEEGLEFCTKAWLLVPSEPKYGYTLAFFQAQAHDEDGAIATLTGMLDRSLAYADAYALLGSIYARRGVKDKAREVYQRAAEIPGLTAQEQAIFKVKSEGQRAKDEK
jgi:tetratricopeptide (TPR) repeat protein